MDPQPVEPAAAALVVGPPVVPEVERTYCHCYTGRQVAERLVVERRPVVGPRQAVGQLQAVSAQ